MHPKLTSYILNCSSRINDLPTNRKSLLLPLSKDIAAEIAAKKTPLLNFICTHNSRRSHLAHIWASVMANHFKLPVLECYSGGTHATAMHPNTIAALTRAGFQVNIESNSADYNPVYLVRYSTEHPPERCFSKVYNQPPNPKDNYIAVMTCSEADDACPIVVGASKRHAITYEDPKISDGTPFESTTYDQRSEQIATEMLYLMSEVKGKVG